MALSRWRRVALILAIAAAVFAAADPASAELPPGGSFVDDDFNTHEANIEAIRADGITFGCNPPINDRYCPGDIVTRGQMAAFLDRAFDLPATTGDFFIDDNGTTFEANINRMAAAGITLGCNPPVNDMYCPGGGVSRYEMAAFLDRILHLTDDGGKDWFADDDGSPFEPAVNRIAHLGVTLGCNPPTNDHYCGSAKVQRDQMASFLARALGLEPIIPPPPPPPPPVDEILAIGDSVMEGAAEPFDKPNLESEIDGITVDALQSRQFFQAKSALASWRAKGLDPDVVIVHLGTNGPPTSSQFDSFMAAAADIDRVLFVTVRLDHSSESTTNTVLKSNVPKHDNAELVDWHALSDSHPGWFDSNCGCHIGKTGRTAYVDLIKSTIFP